MPAVQNLVLATKFPTFSHGEMFLDDFNDSLRWLSQCQLHADLADFSELTARRAKNHSRTGDSTAEQDN